jgi:predicted GNAT family N-acyltransferase
MNSISVRLARTLSERKEAFSVRFEVFTKEQKIDTKLDFDGKDKDAKHVIAILKEKVIGTTRLRFIGKKVKLERLAILKKFRGKGFGKEIMTYVVRYCRLKKAAEITFHSQYYAKEFYLKCGFSERGDPFDEADIKHIEMFMRLK